MKFSEKGIDWGYISKDILSHYAPKLPFKYLVQERDTIYLDKEIEVRNIREKKRVSLKNVR